MEEERYHEALAIWRDGRHEEAVRIFLAEAEPWQIAAATLDILDTQGREWVQLWGDWLMCVDEPHTIQNYPSGILNTACQSTST